MQAVSKSDLIISSAESFQMSCLRLAVVALAFSRSDEPGRGDEAGGNAESGEAISESIYDTFAASILLLTCFECVHISLEHNLLTCALKILSIQNRSTR